MRKTFILLSLLLLLVSCGKSDNQKSYKDVEEKAKTGLTNYIFKMRLSPYEVRDYEVVYVNDSICVLHFFLIGEREEPPRGRFNNKMEYVLLLYDNEWYDNICVASYVKSDYLSASSMEVAENNPDKNIVERMHKEREKAEKTGDDYYYAAFTYLVAAENGFKADLEWKRNLNIVDSEADSE